MSEDWESVKARLEKEGAGNQTIAADIRAALERVEHYESAFDRATEWIKKHLPDTPSGSLILDALRQRVEELEREAAELKGQFNLATATQVVAALQLRAEAAEAEVARLRDIISPGDAAAYEEGMAALQAEVTEWRDTARSEMAGRAAAEAEVERLRNWIDDANLLCDCGAFDTDQLVTRGECPDCRKAALAPEVKPEDAVDAADAEQTRALWNSRTDTVGGSDKGFVKVVMNAPEVKPKGSACADRAETVEQTHARWSASSEVK